MAAIFHHAPGVEVAANEFPHTATVFVANDIDDKRTFISGDSVLEILAEARILTVSEPAEDGSITLTEGCSQFYKAHLSREDFAALLDELRARAGL